LYKCVCSAAEAAARALKTVWTPAATSLPLVGGKPVVLARNTVPQNLLKLEKGLQDTLLDPKKQSKLGKKIVGGTSAAKWYVLVPFDSTVFSNILAGVLLMVASFVVGTMCMLFWFCWF